MELIFPKFPPERLVQIPILTLAHMGDCVFELLARTYTAQQGIYLASKAHRLTVTLVSAKAQAVMVYGIMDALTDEERGYYSRGRNSNPRTTAKNANIREYMASTGLEALFGALYFQGRQDRVVELFNLCVEVHKGVSK